MIFEKLFEIAPKIRCSIIPSKLRHTKQILKLIFTSNQYPLSFSNFLRILSILVVGFATSDFTDVSIGI